MDALDQDKLQKYFRAMFATAKVPAQQPHQTVFDRHRSADIQVQGKKVAVYELGAGAPVLLVHGHKVRATQMAAFVDPLLARGLKVVAFDLPGHGESDGDATNTLEITEAIDLLGARYGAFKSIIAHSFGCIAAARALALDIVRADSYVSLASPADQSVLMEWKFAVHKIEKPYRQPLIEMHREVLGENFFHDLSPVNLVPQITCKHLLIHDEDDQIVAFSEFESLCRVKNGNGTAHATRGMNHGGLLSAPDVIQKVVEFVA